MCVDIRQCVVCLFVCDGGVGDGVTARVRNGSVPSPSHIHFHPHSQHLTSHTHVPVVMLALDVPLGTWCCCCCCCLCVTANHLPKHPLVPLFAVCTGSPACVREAVAHYGIKKRVLHLAGRLGRYTHTHIHTGAATRSSGSFGFERGGGRRG